jgi:hypothetical protein
MNPRPQCPHAELAVGWALHALEPADEDLLIEHLPDCHICREAIQQTEELTWILSSANEQVEPRPELRAELMAAAAATPQTPKAEREDAWPKASGMPAGRPITVGWHANGDPGAASKFAEPLADRRGLMRRSRMIALVATVALAVVGVGGLAYRQVEGAHQQRQVQAAGPGQLSRILAQVAAPGVRYAVLSSPSGEPVAGVKVSGGQREVFPYALVPNNNQQTIYVLWGIANGAPVPIGGFDVPSSGNGLRRVGPPLQGNDTFDAYAISIEHGRTPPEAPSLVVASGQVAS